MVNNLKVSVLVEQNHGGLLCYSKHKLGRMDCCRSKGVPTTCIGVCACMEDSMNKPSTIMTPPHLGNCGNYKSSILECTNNFACKGNFISV